VRFSADLASDVAFSSRGLRENMLSGTLPTDLARLDIAAMCGFLLFALFAWY
jgi:hypothetical protein